MNKKLFFYKIILLFFIFICVCSTVLADDIYPAYDDFDFSELLEDDDSVEASSDYSQLSTINSKAYVVIDRNSNTVLVGNNENQKKKMASTTKIMTAIVVIENCNLSEIVEISKKAASVGGSRLGLHTGDKVTVLNLLYGLLLCSGNDAAIALAEHTSGSVTEFANLMNEKATELGLSDTHFVTPHGLDEDEHYTTAYELALIANYALNNKTFANIVNTKKTTIYINNYSKSISNTNELLGNLTGVYGVKTGFTNGANRCLVTACKRDDMDIICVVLGADTKKYRTQDSIKLIEYCFANFTFVNIEDKINEYFDNWKNENIENIKIDKCIKSDFDLSYTEIEHPVIPIRSDLIDSFNFYVSYDNILEAPIDEGYVVGKITVEVDGKIIYSGEISFTSSIERKKINDYVLEFYKDFITYVSEIAI